LFLAVRREVLLTCQFWRSAFYLVYPRATSTDFTMKIFLFAATSSSWHHSIFYEPHPVPCGGYRPLRCRPPTFFDCRFQFRENFVLQVPSLGWGLPFFVQVNKNISPQAFSRFQGSGLGRSAPSLGTPASDRLWSYVWLSLILTFEFKIYFLKYLTL